MAPKVFSECRFLRGKWNGVFRMVLSIDDGATEIETDDRLKSPSRVAISGVRELSSIAATMDRRMSRIRTRI